MPNDESADPFDSYVVVRNARGDHSVWPIIKPMPDGWEPLECTGDRNHCLDWIGENWAGPGMAVG